MLRAPELDDLPNGTATNLIGEFFPPLPTRLLFRAPELDDLPNGTVANLIGAYLPPGPPINTQTWLPNPYAASLAPPPSGGGGQAGHPF